MGKIRILDDSIVSLISAGEVIENPSSIVKELIENALDAGATNIEIQIEKGGIDSIIVSDNGEGIEKEDCLVCTLRHSTSKIAKREDIDSILTYGFRGEALASIASVADLEIVTRYKKEEIGTRIKSRAGQIPDISRASRPAGTTVEVSQLFRNVPARRKHLSEPRVESQRVLDSVIKHAIIRNDIGFRFIRDEKVILDCPSGQTPMDRALILWGPDTASSLIEIKRKKMGISIEGFIGEPSVSRGNRGRELFSVRNRPIEDQALSAALEAAYSSLLMRGRYPVCSLDIDVDVSKVDANVHPTKREVRIQDFDLVRNVLRDVLTNALQDSKPMEIPETLEGIVEIESVDTQIFQDASSARSDGRALLLEETMLVKPVSSAEPDLNIEDLGSIFNILGQVNMVYIVAATEGGLVMVDQHAAHERILYEQLRKQVNDGTVVVQELLEPIVLKLGLGDAEKILALDETLETLGYTIGSFGGNEVLVSTIPEILGKRVSEDELVALVDRILDIGEKDAVEQFMDELVKVTACHSAIRSGQKIGHEESKRLIFNLFETDAKYQCAHGRPSIIRITKQELDERFGRTGAEAMARFKARHRAG
ncbi:MAG: DNA mismatch repair endonuclease MutL [Candidatus Thorarchaeota archaeon]|nr:DNA mismatch repair endonuclease MutL [Candidatus Thorarchaeota archaeon]